MNFESATTPSTKNDLPDENDVDSGFVANFASSSDRPEPESVFESFGAPFGATNPDFSQESTEQKTTPPKAKRSKPEGIGQLINHHGETANYAFAKWAQEFDESESFELVCVQRMDELIREALAYEESLKQQKMQLIQNLERLTKSLK